MPEHLNSSPESFNSEEYALALQELQSVINTSPVIEYGVYDCSYGQDGSYYLINAKPMVAGPDFKVTEQGKKIGYRQVEFIDPNTEATIKILEKHELAKEKEQIDAYVFLSESKRGEIPYLQLLFNFRKGPLISRTVTYNDFETDINKWPVSQLLNVIAEQNRKQQG